MSIQSQIKNMQHIYRLINKDLSYIYGERENGSNGAKKEFLSKSASFLRALGKDLGLKEIKVTTNAGGIAVSGDISLYSVWNDGNGLFLQISQTNIQPQAFLYRHITSIKDYGGGCNQWLSCSLFSTGEYEKLIEKLLYLRKPLGADCYVA